MIVSSFDSMDLTLFTAVLDRACLDVRELDESRRQAMAARILHLAQTGERDFEALRKHATTSNIRDLRKMTRLDQFFPSRRFSMIDPAF